MLWIIWLLLICVYFFAVKAVGKVYEQIEKETVRRIKRELETQKVLAPLVELTSITVDVLSSIERTPLKPSEPQSTYRRRHPNDNVVVSKYRNRL